MGVSKNKETPKMDGENNGKPNFLMDDLGGPPLFFGNTHINFTTPETFGVPFPLFFGWLFGRVKST